MRIYRFDSLSKLELLNVQADLVTYRSRRAVQLLEHYEQKPGEPESEEHPIAILPETHFTDGIIEANIAGAPRPDAEDFARGFVGIAFRVQPHGSQFECFYLRPTNARAMDQLRRNHSTQYISHPDYPWYRLRDEAPGVYESYVDLQPGEWTRIKIEVSGAKALLYVNGGKQPCLVVNDLKLPPAPGQVALWIGTGTQAYFNKVIVRDLA